MKYDSYKINFEAMCRTDVLGEEVILPYSEELDNAVCLINKLCSAEVLRREKHLLREFIAKKHSELRKVKSVDDKVRILLEIVNYERDKKYEL